MDATNCLAKVQGRETEYFELLSLCLNAVLECKALCGVVYNEEGAPSEECQDDLTRYKRKVRKAKAIIVTRLGVKPLFVVQSISHPDEMVKKLNQSYAASTTANKIAVMTIQIQSM